MEDILDKDRRESLMFDNAFQRSRVYFEVLQMLRLFSNYIGVTGSDLQGSVLDKVFIPVSQPTFVKESEKILRNNWELLKLHQSEAQERLLQRISKKMEEVMSLRDAVCSQRFAILCRPNISHSCSTQHPYGRRQRQQRWIAMSLSLPLWRLCTCPHASSRYVALNTLTNMRLITA